MSKTSSLFSATTTADEVIAGHDLSGRTAIVTGASSGIGVETARALASAGADVTLAVRDVTAGRNVAERINAAHPGRATAEALDLGSLRSIKAFASRWGERPLNILINNAGVMATPEGRTEDGFETQFGTNHLGHFALSIGLIPALRRGAPARVVVVSSSAHALADVDLDDPHWRARPYQALTAYAASKTANVLFAVEFSRRYGREGVTANAVHPGLINTNLGRHNAKEVQDVVAAMRNEVVFKSPQQGASTSIWAAVAPELEGRGGLFLADCAEAEVRSGVHSMTSVAPHALDAEKARSLWVFSEREVGVQAPEGAYFVG